MKEESSKLHSGIRFSLGFVAILWFIKAIEQASSLDFAVLGIYPRTLMGSVGIITGPLIHGDVSHLLSNSIPLLALLIGLFYFYKPIALRVFILVYVMTGVWVWFAARSAYHIGASGLVYGLISFLLMSGFLRRDIKSLTVSFIVLILYGGNMFYGIIPGDSGVSWESHLLGAIAGTFCAFYFKNVFVFDSDEPEKETLFETKNYFTGSNIHSYQINKDQKPRTYTYKLKNKK